MNQFDELIEAAKADERERRKAQREIARAKGPPRSKKMLLLRIFSDTAEPWSVRLDARRLLEVADLRPRDFESQFSDFTKWREEFKND